MAQLLPAFAVLLKVLYLGRRRRYPARPRLYGEHLVFAAHNHAFLFVAGILIGVTNLAAGAVNFVINYRIVLAPFNTPAFNDQVANVNAITRLVLVLPDMLALFFAFLLF